MWYITICLNQINLYNNILGLATQLLNYLLLCASVLADGIVDIVISLIHQQV